jgi:hypothetical protein
VKLPQQVNKGYDDIKQRFVSVQEDHKNSLSSMELEDIDRTVWPIEKMKEYLEFTDASQMRTYNYSKLKKRSDLAVVLEEFVDTSKSILDLAFTYVEPYDFNGALCRQLYSVEMNIIAKLNPKTQYQLLSIFETISEGKL